MYAVEPCENGFTSFTSYLFAIFMLASSVELFTNIPLAVKVVLDRSFLSDAFGDVVYWRRWK